MKNQLDFDLYRTECEESASLNANKHQGDSGCNVLDFYQEQRVIEEQKRAVLTQKVVALCAHRPR